MDQHDNNPFGENGPFGMIFRAPSPEEIQAQLDRQQMTQDVQSHEVKGFLEGLTEEQLKMLRGMIHVVEHSQAHDVNVGSYYIGLITGVLSDLYKICIACGVNHDKQAEDLLKPTNTEAPPKSDKELMEEYNVRKYSVFSDRVICKSCSHVFVSLGYRMDAGEDCPECKAQDND